MSYKGVEWAYGIEGLTATEKAILVYLGFRMNDTTHKVWPKKKTIMEDTGYSRSAVIRTCNSLESQGLIKFVEAGKYSKVYELQLTLTSTSDVAESYPRDGRKVPQRSPEATPYMNRQRRDKRRDREPSVKINADSRGGGNPDYLGDENLTPERARAECKPVEHEGKLQYRPVPVLKLWRQLITLNYPDQNFQADFTMREKGLFKQMLLKAGDYLPDALVAVVGDWPRFCRYVKANKALRKTPYEPDPGFVLTHICAALNFMAELEEAPDLPPPPEPNRRRVQYVVEQEKREIVDNI